jgi:predicted Zn-dependent protease
VILAAILEEEPDSPQARLNLARSLSLAGRWEEAVSQYDELLRRYPDQPTFRLYRAAALREAGRPRQAAAAFREVVELLPQESRPRVEEAEALAAGGDFAAARERLEAGLAAQPRKGELLHALARLLAAAADPGVRDPERALSLARLVYDARPDPLHAETLAMALAASGRFAEAAELQARLAADGGGDDEARLRRRENLERYRAGRPAAPPW